MSNNIAQSNSARLATVGELRKNLFAVHLSPVPCNSTLRAWLDAARVPRFKSNPLAKRGGGPCFYSVAHVEKFLRSRMLPGKVVGL